MLKHLFPLLLNITLASCSSIPMSSMYQLSKLDVLTMDPQFLSIAIRTHEAFGLREGDVVFRMGYHAEDIKLDEEFIVKPTNTPISKTRIAQTLPDQKIIQLLLADTDVQRMRELQQEIQQHKQGGGDGKGYMTIALVGICRSSEVPDGKLTADTFIKTYEINNYIPLVKNFNLRGEHPGWNNNIESWPECEYE